MADRLQAILSNPQYHDYLAILKGARNGLVYGVKIRFPHALLMAILFGRGDWKSRLLNIFRLTKNHALSLAKFVTIYKTLLLVQKKVNGGEKRLLDDFIAGCIGGYYVFGERSAINEQIVLYVCSRVVASFIPRADSGYAPSSSSETKLIPPNRRFFAIFAAVSWGAAVWLFNNRGHTIQPGMFHSMTYLYRDSEKWSNLRTLLWHNK